MLSLQFSFLPLGFYDMAGCHHRMATQHPRPRKSHHLANLLPHIWPVTMHPAVGAKGFRLHKGAAVAALTGIPVQRSACRAKLFLAPMLFPTV